MTAVAARDWPAQDIETPGLSEQSFEDAEFTIPSCDPQSRKAFVIILRVDLELPLGGEATLTPSFAPLDPASAGPSLPPLRLKADPPAWRPLFSQPPSKHPRPRNEAIQRLNGSAVRSLTAILEGDGGPQRADFRRLAEAFLSRLSTAGFVAKVHSEKHMTASASISKATRASPLGELVADKRWAKLFDGETDYQTVTIEIAREGAPYPLAGFVMQAGLRGHGAALGLRPPRLTGAVWMIDHPSVESELGLRGDAMDRLFEEWIAGVAPTQAWRVQAAWIPEFDTYEDYASTLYEQARTVEPRDAAKLDLATALARFAQRLRFVSPRLWLGAHFAAQIDRASLERVATVSTEGVTMKIELRPEYGLADLEGVLATIL
jgi:hypothetical protein